MTDEKLEKINKLHERIIKIKGIIGSCKELKKLRNIHWTMGSEYQSYKYGTTYIDMVLSEDEMRLMDDFLDKLIFKKEKELTVLNEQYSKY